MARRDANQLFNFVNFEVKKILEDMLTEVRNIKDESLENTKQLSTFYQYLESFVNHALERMQTTYLENNEKELYYCKLWHENIKLQQSYTAASKVLEENREKYSKHENELENQYKTNQKKIEQIKKQFLIDSQSKSEEYERKQIVEKQVFDKRIDNLLQMISQTERKIKNNTEEFKRSEDELKTRRLKVISQYNSLFDHYKSEIEEKTKGINELKKEIENFKIKNAEIKREVEEQSIVCKSLITNVENHNRDILSRVARTSAAIKIQNWWRKIRPHKRSKKSKKKVSKKKTVQKVKTKK